MTLQCVIMFSICLLSCPQCRSLSWVWWSCHISHFSHQSSPLTAFTISHFSKLFSWCILTFSPFKLLSFFSPLPSHLAVSFSLIPLPASTFTHSSSKSVFHPLLIFLTLLSRLQFYFTFRSFPSTVLSCFLPLLTCVCPLFLLCFSHFPSLFIALLFHPTGSVFIFSYIPCLYHLFPLLDSISIPFLFHFPSSVYSPLSCFVFTFVFQAHCLFSVLSETVAEAVRGSYQPQ